MLRQEDRRHVWLVINMALSDKGIREAIKAGQIKIAPFEPDNVQAASVDLTVGPTIKVLEGDEEIDPAQDLRARYRVVDLTKGTFRLQPGQVVLADCRERIDTGKHCAFVFTRSSYARMGLNCSLVGYLNPGYAGNPPIVIANLTGRVVLLDSGLRLVQIVFLEVGEVEQMYHAKKNPKYQDENEATPPMQHLDEEIDELLLQRGLMQKDLLRAKQIILQEAITSARDVVKKYVPSGEK